MKSNKLFSWIAGVTLASTIAFISCDDVLSQQLLDKLGQQQESPFVLLLEGATDGASYTAAVVNETGANVAAVAGKAAEEGVSFTFVVKAGEYDVRITEKVGKALTVKSESVVFAGTGGNWTVSWAGLTVLKEPAAAGTPDGGEAAVDTPEAETPVAETPEADDPESVVEYPFADEAEGTDGGEAAVAEEADEDEADGIDFSSGHVVKFESNGGSAVKAFTVQDGEKADLPPAPEKARHVFEGWYADSELTEPFRFDDPILRNVTLYAKWTPLFYLVSFESNGGSAVAAAEVDPGETVPAPETEWALHTFEGWYADSELTVPYSFYDPVYGNKTLYAKWTAYVAYLVSFESNGGSAVAALEVFPPEVPEATEENPEPEIPLVAVTPPKPPVKAGYLFAGWYTDSALTVPYDFDKLINFDELIEPVVVLYAKWWSDTFESVTAVSALSAHLGSSSALKSGLVYSGTGSDPYKIKVNVNLAGGAWSALVDALDPAGKHFDLDLSESSVGGEFDGAKKKGGRILSLVLPDDATSIKADSFNGSSGGSLPLRSISGANVVTIGDKAFYFAQSLSSVDFPKAESIGAEAFSLAALSNVSFPSVKTVGFQAFHSASLSRAEFPELREIGDYAFAKTSLSYLYIPKAEKLGTGAFNWTGYKTQSITITLGVKPPAFEGVLFVPSSYGGFVPIPQTITLEIPYAEVINVGLGSSHYSADWQTKFKAGGDVTIRFASY